MASSPAAITAAEAPAAPAVRQRPNVAPIVLGVLALVGIAYGVQRWRWGMNHIETDNAQVEGHVVPSSAKVSGYVTQVAVIDNQTVKAGDLLVQLDDREYKDKLAQAEADLQVAIANGGAPGRAGQTEAQLAGARASVVQAKANADRATADADRARALAPRGIVSRAQLDAAVGASDAANAALDAAQKQVLAMQAAWAGGNAKVESARAARDRAALDVAYTRIEAPIDGIVSRKSVEIGQLVQPGQALMSVVPLNDVWVVANFKETEIRGVNPGDAAEVRVDAYPGAKFRGHVESLSPATGAKFSLLPPDNATGNFTKVVQRIPVKIRVDGPADAAHPLRPGMSVTATVTTK